MNCVSYEIAVRLKNADFPRKIKWTWAYNPADKSGPYFDVEGHYFGTLYAHTVDEILRFMPAVNIFYTGSKFHVSCGPGESAVIAVSANIHDAAALAWLALNENKTTEI